MGRYTDAYGPNVEQILIQATRVVTSKVPRQVRNELMAAVKAGVLGRLPKDGLKPEIFFHPDHKHGAVDRQKREAEYAVSCIATVMAGPAEYENDRKALEYRLLGKTAEDRENILSLAGKASNSDDAAAIELGEIVTDILTTAPKRTNSQG